MKTSAVHSVVATQNWIMKVSHYTVNIAHQSDTALIAIQVIKENLIKLFIFTLKLIAYGFFDILERLTCLERRFS